MSRMKPQLPIVAKVLIGVVLAAFAVNLGGMFLTQTGMLGVQESPLSEWKGRAAPELIVSTIDGHSVRLLDLRGRRVIVDFWATWCPPCIKEIPHLQNLSEEFTDDDLLVIGVSDEDAATVRAFASSHRITYPLGEPVKSAPPFSDITAVPTTFFIDRNGMIESVLEGYHSYDELREHAIGTVD